jgi:hypothetical protein
LLHKLRSKDVKNKTLINKTQQTRKTKIGGAKMGNKTKDHIESKVEEEQSVTLPHQ